ALCRVHKDDLYMAAKCCRGRLQQELASSAPELIVPLGANAIRHTFGITDGSTTAVDAYRGTVSILAWRDRKPHNITPFAPAQYPDAPRSYILPLMQPYIALRDPKWEPII